MLDWDALLTPIPRISRENSPSEMKNRYAACLQAFISLFSIAFEPRSFNLLLFSFVALRRMRKNCLEVFISFFSLALEPRSFHFISYSATAAAFFLSWLIDAMRRMRKNNKANGKNTVVEAFSYLTLKQYPFPASNSSTDHLALTLSRSIIPPNYPTGAIAIDIK